MSWVYRQVSQYDADKQLEAGATVGQVNAYEVGFYDPTGAWVKDSRHKNRNTAADRVNWLNGGMGGRIQRVEIVDRFKNQTDFEGRDHG